MENTIESYKIVEISSSNDGSGAGGAMTESHKSISLGKGLPKDKREFIDDELKYDIIVNGVEFKNCEIGSDFRSRDMFRNEEGLLFDIKDGYMMRVSEGEREKAQERKREKYLTNAIEEKRKLEAEEKRIRELIKIGKTKEEQYVSLEDHLNAHMYTSEKFDKELLYDVKLPNGKELKNCNVHNDNYKFKSEETKGLYANLDMNFGIRASKESQERKRKKDLIVVGEKRKKLEERIEELSR